MRKILGISLLVMVVVLMSCPSVAVAQTRAVQLGQMIEALYAHHPLTARTGIYEEQRRQEEALLHKSWLPGVQLQGQATWQSEVTGIDLDMNIPGMDLAIPQAPNDQYKLALELQQIVYDGGRTKYSQQLKDAQYQGNAHAHAMDMHALEQQVTTLYFASMQMACQQAQVALKVEELQARLQQLHAAVAHGALLPAQLETLQAEKLKLEQQILQLQAKQRGINNQLTLLTGQPLQGDARFALPQVAWQAQVQWQRPVFDYLKNQQQQLQVQQALTKVANRPHIFGFAQAGYGRPGLNMLSDAFNDYYLVGVKISWHLWDWNKGQTQSALIEQQKQLVQLNAADVKIKFRQQLANKQAEIDQLQNALLKDDEIIALRQSVYDAAKAKLKNGTLTATDYLTELNAVTDARLAKELRTLYLQKSKLEYMQIMGIPLPEVLGNTIAIEESNEHTGLQ